MAVSYGATGTVATLSGATINITPNAPASIAAGDLLVILLGVKPDTSVNDETITDWTFVGEYSGGGGTTGIDTGPTLIAVYTKEAVGGDTMPTINITSTNVAWATCTRFAKGSGTWDVAIAGGTDSTTGTAWSVTCDVDPGLEAGDFVLVGSVIPTDVTTPAQFSSEAVSATGVSAWSAFTEIAEPDTNVGNDIGGFLFYGSVTTGTSSAAPVITATAGGTTTNVRGPSVLVRVREVTVTTHSADGAITSTPTVAATAATTKPVTGTGITSSPAVAAAAASTKPVSGTGITVAYTVAASATRVAVATGTGITISPAVAASADRIAVATGTGVTISPAVTASATSTKPVTGTGVTIAYTVAATAASTKPIDGAALTVTPSVAAAATATKPIDGTGVTIPIAVAATADVVGAGVSIDGSITIAPSVSAAADVVKPIAGTALTITPSVAAAGVVVDSATGTGVTIAPSVTASATVVKGIAGTALTITPVTAGDLNRTALAEAALVLAVTTTAAGDVTTPSATQGGRARSGAGGPTARGGSGAAPRARTGGSGPHSGSNSTTGPRARTGPNGPHAGGAS